MPGTTAKEPTRHGLTVARYAVIKAHLGHYPPERSDQILAQNTEFRQWLLQHQRRGGHDR